MYRKCGGISCKKGEKKRNKKKFFQGFDVINICQQNEFAFV